MMVILTADLEVMIIKKVLYQNCVNKQDDQAAADRYSTRPGYSERKQVLSLT